MNMRSTKAVVLFVSSLILLGGSLCFGQAPANAADNLLKKPTEDKRSWEIKFFGNPGAIDTDSSERHDGHPSLRIRQGKPAGVAFLNQTIAVKPETRYRFSGWIKATKMILPKEQAHQKSGAALAIFQGLGNSGWVSDTDGWVRASVDFRTKPGQTSVQLGPRVGFNEWRPLGTAWFADLSLVEVGR